MDADQSAYKAVEDSDRFKSKDSINYRNTENKVGEQVQYEKEITSILCPKAYRKGFDTCKSISFDIFEVIYSRIDEELNPKESEN